MVATGTGARRDVHYRARAAAILRAEGRIDDLELRRRIDRRLERDLVLGHVVQVDAVNLEVIRILASAASDVGIRSQTPAGGSQESIRRRNHSAGCQVGQIEKMPPVQWDILHGIFVYP